MFKPLLEKLDVEVKNRASLERALPGGFFETVIKNKAVQNATRKLLAADLKEGQPSLIGRGGNIIELFRGGNWEISMVRQSLFAVEPFLASSPNPLLGVCVAGEGTSKLCYYKIDGDTRALSQAKNWVLREDRIVEIIKGDIFSCNDPDLVMDFVELAPDHVFLRFVHKPVAPLTYVFERASKAFSYHTFSDETTTGQFFFADLLLNIVNNPDCKGRMSPDQTRDLITFCNREIGKEEINMKARWRLLQTLGLISEKDTVRWLKIFSNHPDPGVSRLAEATLAQVSGGQGSGH